MFDTASGWGKKSSPAAWENVPYFSTEAYKFRLGDVNFHQSCRLKAKVYRPMSSLAGRRVADKNWLFCRSLLGKSRLETMELPGVFFSGFKPAFPVFLLPVSSISEGSRRSENKGFFDTEHVGLA